MDKEEKIIQTGNEFQLAYELAKKDYDYEEIMINLVGTDNIKKHISIINLKSIRNERDAKILVSNMINEEGIIRESVANKVSELIKDNRYKEYFQSEEIIEVIIKAINDMNPNVSRIVSGFLDKFEEQGIILNRLIEKGLKVSKDLEEYKKNDRKEKSYKKNKKQFELYWSLEGIANLRIGDIGEDLKELLRYGSLYEDYTIREKVAKIITKIEEERIDKDIKEIENKLRQDNNFYVKRYIK